MEETKDNTESVSTKDKVLDDTVDLTPRGNYEENQDVLEKFVATVGSTSSKSAVSRKFNSSVYQRYFSIVTVEPSATVRCNLTSCVGDVKCDEVLKLQKDTYFNLKRHLERVHNIKEIDKVGPSVVKKQMTLQEFKDSKTKYPATHPRQKAFDRDIVNMFAIDGLPFDTVEKDGFLTLVEHLDTRITVKSRRYYIRLLSDIVEQEIMPKLKTSLLETEKRFCHFSCDVWTSRKGVGILCILAHFINQNWKLESKVLLFEPLTEKHTGDYIRMVFMKCISDYGVPANWGGFVVTDNASNLKKCFNLENIVQDQNWHSLWVPDDVEQPQPNNCDGIFGDAGIYEVESEDDEECLFVSELLEHFSDGLYNPLSELPISGHLFCAAHTLQLAINDSIKENAEVKDMLQYVSKVMVFFKRSTKWRDELKKLCTDEPVTAVPTRWNSNLAMLTRFEKNEFFLSIRNVLELAELDHATRSPPNAPHLSDQAKAKELCMILAPMGVATDQLQGDGCTSNVLIISVIKAYRQLSKMTPSYYLNFRNSLLKSLKRRMEPLIIKREYVLAALLDPRIKNDVFRLSWTDSTIVPISIATEMEALEILRDEFAKWVVSESENSTANEVECQGTSAKSVCDDDSLFGILSEAPPRTTHKNEVEQYIGEASSPPSSCPLQFWSTNANRFPIMSKIARKYLGIPSTSAGVERVFSITGWLGRARRAQISTTNVSKLLLVREDVKNEISRTAKKRKLSA